MQDGVEGIPGKKQCGQASKGTHQHVSRERSREDDAEKRRLDARLTEEVLAFVPGNFSFWSYSNDLK